VKARGHRNSFRLHRSSRYGSCHLPNKVH